MHTTEPKLDDSLSPVFTLESTSDRVFGVLLAPFQAFSGHDASWGWGKPWAIVAFAGLVVGVIFLARIDADAFQHWAWEKSQANMSKEQRAQLEQPEVAEMMAKGRRVQSFLMKAGALAGPPLIGLVGILFAGFWLYLVANFLAKEPPDPMRCFSVAAYASLANLVDLAGAGAGVLMANPMPRPNLSALVSDPMTQPLLSASLERIGPGLFLYYLLLTAGLERSLGLTRRRAVLVTVGVYLLVSLLAISMGALGQLGVKAS